MHSTMDLWAKAREVKTASQWAKELNLTPSAFSQAKTQGRLSPMIAGAVAIELGEDATKWVAIAALEGSVREKENPLLHKVERAVKGWRKR